MLREAISLFAKNAETAAESSRKVRFLITRACDDSCCILKSGMPKNLSHDSELILDSWSGLYKILAEDNLCGVQRGKERNALILV